MERLISAATMDVFLEIFVNYSQPDVELRAYLPYLQGLIKKLIEIKQYEKLSRLCHVVDRLDMKQVNTIKKILENKEQKMPEEFIKSLDDRLALLMESTKTEKSKAPVKGRWNKFFGKKE